TDFVETVTLRWISAAWPLFDPSLVSPLALAVRVKFTVIGIAMVLAGIWLGRANKSLGARIVALLAIIGGLGSVWLMYSDGRMAGTAAVGIGWLAMTIYAGTRTFA